MPQYRTNSNGWVAGRRVKADDLVELTEGQAKYEPVTAADAPTKAKAKRSRDGAGLMDDLPSGALAVVADGDAPAKEASE